MPRYTSADFSAVSKCRPVVDELQDSVRPIAGREGAGGRALDIVVPMVLRFEWFGRQAPRAGVR